MIRLLAAAVATALLAVPATADTIRTAPADDLPWATTPEGVAFAALVGDRFVEPYMAMVRLPGGLVSPAHVKTAAMFGVVVEGVMTHVPEGADPLGGARLGAGSFYEIPADTPHVSSCVSDVACVTFLYQDGKFDFLPTQP